MSVAKQVMDVTQDFLVGPGHEKTQQILLIILLAQGFIAYARVLLFARVSEKSIF